MFNIRQLGFDAERAFNVIRIDPESLMHVNSDSHAVLQSSGMGWDNRQYAAFQIFAAILFALASSLIISLAVVSFKLNPLLLLLSIPCSIFGLIATRLHVARKANENERELEANLIDAVRHLASELRSDAALLPALASVANGGYGSVSRAISEAISLIREGESVEEAFLEVGEKTHSLNFNIFAASVAHAASSGSDLSTIAEQFGNGLESSFKSKLSDYASECGKLSTITIVATGVLPGILIFALVEGGFVFGFRIPIELFLVAYLLLFPLTKYFLQAKLALSSLGV